jgi:hypothetical protein
MVGLFFGRDGNNIEVVHHFEAGYISQFLLVEVYEKFHLILCMKGNFLSTS